MRLRDLPGAAILGLLASVLAHTAAYGSGHAMGGGYHDALLGGAALAALVALAIAVSVAWTCAGSIPDGTVVGARLRSLMPSWPAVLVGATAWFALGEHVEPHHEAVAPLIIVAALAFAAWSVLVCARALVAFLSAIVIAIRTTAFAELAHERPQRLRFFPPLSRSLLRAQRRYARPPPVAIARA